MVREAVRILTTQGLLETRHGIGTTVRSVSRDEVIRPLKMFLRIRGQDVSVEHLHHVRSILEVENAVLAAEQGTHEDIAELDAICRAMQAASGNPEEFALKDSAFHRRLSETTHNPVLILLLDSVHDMMAEVRALVSAESTVYERVMPTHIRILDAVATHDRIAARQAMREHLEIAFALQVELIQKRKDGRG